MRDAATTTYPLRADGTSVHAEYTWKMSLVTRPSGRVTGDVGHSPRECPWDKLKQVQSTFPGEEALVSFNYESLGVPRETDNTHRFPPTSIPPSNARKGPPSEGGGCRKATGGCSSGGLLSPPPLKPGAATEPGGVTRESGSGDVLSSGFRHAVRGTPGDAGHSQCECPGKRRNKYVNTTKNALRKPAAQRLPCAGGDVASTRQHPGHRWAGWNVIADYTGDGSWTVGARTMSYTPGLAQAQGANPTTAAYQYSMADHLGSVRQITAQDKSALAHYAYTPYGETDFAAGLSMTHGFTGHRWDAETGLYFAPFRYYAPQNARWMKRDPIGLFGGLNFYLYVSSRPTCLYDPLGLVEVFDDGNIVGAFCNGVIDGALQVVDVAIPIVNPFKDSLYDPNGPGMRSGKVAAEVGVTAGYLALGLRGMKNIKFDPPHKGLGPHVHWGPRLPRSPHPKWHFGPKVPKGSPGRWPGWSEWWKRGRKWRCK